MKHSPLRKRENIDRHTFEKMSRFLDSSKNTPLPVPRKRTRRYLRNYSKVREPLFFQYLFCPCEVDIRCFPVLDLVVSCYLESSHISPCHGPFDRIIILAEQALQVIY